MLISCLCRTLVRVIYPRTSDFCPDWASVHVLVVLSLRDGVCTVRFHPGGFILLCSALHCAAVLTNIGANWNNIPRMEEYHSTSYSG
jgi:hypothetical protein